MKDADFFEKIVENGRVQSKNCVWSTHILKDVTFTLKGNNLSTLWRLLLVRNVLKDRWSFLLKNCICLRYFWICSKRRLKIKKDNARARRVVQIVLEKNGNRETRTVHSLN